MSFNLGKAELLPHSKSGSTSTQCRLDKCHTLACSPEDQALASPGDLAM